MPRTSGCGPAAHQADPHRRGPPSHAELAGHRVPHHAQEQRAEGAVAALRPLLRDALLHGGRQGEHGVQDAAALEGRDRGGGVPQRVEGEAGEDPRAEAGDEAVRRAEQAGEDEGHGLGHVAVDRAAVVLVLTEDQEAHDAEDRPEGAEENGPDGPRDFGRDARLDQRPRHPDREGGRAGGRREAPELRLAPPAARVELQHPQGGVQEHAAGGGHGRYVEDEAGVAGGRVEGGGAQGDEAEHHAVVLGARRPRLAADLQAGRREADGAEHVAELQLGGQAIAQDPVAAAVVVVEAAEHRVQRRARARNRLCCLRGGHGGHRLPG
mmetsp:Transcript_95696/g.298450  ORF Transcript_95696/g.298450 Transcript_95696/m.298450 type:complete len:324 (+) Transcript_95696:33-1004(+)